MKASIAASIQPPPGLLPAATDPRSEAKASAPFDDWDVLFDAVVARLRLSVAEQAVPAAVAEAVLDCAQALERLHTEHLRNRA